MIGIFQNKNLTPQKMKDIEEWHCKAVETLIFRRRTKRHITTIEKRISLKFYEILVADFIQLSKLKSNAAVARINKYKAYKKFFERLYKNYRTKYGRELVEKLGVTVCPYCNRNFINNSKNYAIAQFDHFFSKSEYPVFALSLYNLIPSCASCNSLKGIENFAISPYDKKYTTDKIIKFSYAQKGLSGIEIEVKPLKKEMKTNIKVLQLTKLYSIHSDLINQIILKQKMYNSVYNQFLNSYINEPLINMSFKELYYDNYLTEDKYYLRPLSKFTRDIIDEVEQLANIEN